MNAVHAAISCSISSPGFIDGYDNTILNSVQTSYSITCSRGVDATDPLTTTYSVKVNDGQTPTGNANQAASGGNRLKYDLYINSACSAIWKSNVSVPATAGTITMVGLLPTTVTQNFWGCVLAGPLPAAGVYTDSVTMTPTYSAAGVIAIGTPTVSVKIITPATCTISAIPGITLAYGNAFRLTPATATTSAPVTCSDQLPYTLAVSPTSGVSAGIYYTLSLPGSATGTGAVQNTTITATAPAGQAGTCTTSSCIGAAQPHTLTVTY
ncbi:MAG: spore coat protein U domain-containing protein [Chitinophagaceae bacterium]|nr:spore coat protein U domain-containing protein [Polaromonas sp.]